MKTIGSFLKRHPGCIVVAFIALFAIFPLLPDVLAWPVRVLLLVLFLSLASAVFTKLRAVVQCPKRALFGSLALLLGLGIADGLLETASWLYLKKVPVSGQSLVLTEEQREFVRSIVNNTLKYEVYSPSLAWTIGISQVSESGLYRSNAAGFRANREYTAQKTPGKIRVLSFGDSYTHGDEVGNHETWQHYAEQETPDIEFLNFGVPGYSLTQAYLRYKEVASNFAADYVIIGCMTEDLMRSVNVYYPFRFRNLGHSENAITLPYAALDEAGELVLHPPTIASREGYTAFAENPLPLLKSMSRVDILFHQPAATPLATLLADRWETLETHLAPVVDHTLAAWHGALLSGNDVPRTLRKIKAMGYKARKNRIVDINCRLFERFARDVKSNGSIPVIMWFPSPDDLKAHNGGKGRQYEDCLNYFAERRLPAVDTLDWLKEIAGPDTALPVKSLLTGVHFSAATNAHIGMRVAGLIQDMHASKSR